MLDERGYVNAYVEIAARLQRLRDEFGCLTSRKLTGK